MFTGANGAVLVRYVSMDPDLDFVAAALAELNDFELYTLIRAADTCPVEDAAWPAALAWIEHVADWETDRRAGLGLPLQLPIAAIPPEQIPAAVDIFTQLRWEFAQDDSAVAPLFEGIVGVLTPITFH